ncbi:hypothetical protein Tco_0912393 [Tanacetum coccineum]
MEEKVCKFGLFDYEDHQMNYDNLVGHSIHPGDVVDWEFLSNKGLAQSFFNSINTDTFSGPQWVNLFQINEPIFRELVREFFASFEFDASPCRESIDGATLSGLRSAETVNSTHLTYLFWPSIGDDMFNVGNTKAKSIRDPRIKLAHMKKSLVKMGVIIQLHEGECCWPVTRGDVEEDEGDDEEGDGEGGNEGAGVSRISTGT